MIREPWHPFIVDCISEEGSGEECVSLLPKPIWELRKVFELEGTLTAWNIDVAFPWRRQVNTCVMNGETERQCKNQLPPSLLEKLEEWEHKEAKWTRDTLSRLRKHSAKSVEQSRNST